MEQKFNLPTETVLLPSKGLMYPSGSALASGEVEMKYMTAKEEDILSNQNYIANGTVIDKLLESLIVDKKINYGELLIGDKNAIMVAARILSYGKDYTFNWRGKDHTVDLSTLENKEINYDKIKDSNNNFKFVLPQSGVNVTFKLLNHSDEKAIDREEKGLQKINPDSTAAMTTRLKRMITSVDGNTESKDIRQFVDEYLLAADARALRKEYTDISPDVNIIFTTDAGEEVDLPIGIGFFWPDA